MMTERRATLGSWLDRILIGSVGAMKGINYETQKLAWS
jgi:hypothetical protein